MFANDWDEYPPDVALRLLLEQMEKDAIELSVEMKKVYENACCAIGRHPILTTPPKTAEDYGRFVKFELDEVRWYIAPLYD